MDSHDKELAEKLEEARLCILSMDVNELLDLLQKLTEERKILYEALGRVQGRCTDLEMERRRLVADNKELRTSIDKITVINELS